MIELMRTTSDHPDFRELVKLLDADLAQRDGDKHSFYAQYNTLDRIRHVVLAHEDGHPLGCGAIKQFGEGVMEVKRMYVVPGNRNRGIATLILLELERWAAELFSTLCVLETGKGQPEAIRLYEKNGYARIPNYGQYAGVENSVCFEKKLT